MKDTRSAARCTWSRALTLGLLLAAFVVVSLWAGAGIAKRETAVERKTTELHTGEVVIGGARSPYLEAGSSNVPDAAVHEHGDPGSSRDWEDPMSPVGQFGRAVAPDMPGFGNAEEPEGFDCTAEAHARHLDGFLQEIGVNRVHLILHHSGGPWGLGWAIENPDAFASVVLMNTGGRDPSRHCIM